MTSTCEHRTCWKDVIIIPRVFYGGRVPAIVGLALRADIAWLLCSTTRTLGGTSSLAVVRASASRARLIVESVRHVNTTPPTSCMQRTITLAGISYHCFVLSFKFFCCSTLSRKHWPSHNGSANTPSPQPATARTELVVRRHHKSSASIIFFAVLSQRTPSARTPYPLNSQPAQSDSANSSKEGKWLTCVI